MPEREERLGIPLIKAKVLIRLFFVVSDPDSIGYPLYVDSDQAKTKCHPKRRNFYFMMRWMLFLKS
jgi:hypothetical protein